MTTNTGIYPTDFAAMLVDRAGEKYQPSNGTEGECFFASWCNQCARDKSMNGEKDWDDCAPNEICLIISNSMAYSPSDPEYPIEWQYGKDGQPCCTAFTPKDSPIPEPRCEHTADIFGEVQ